MLGPCDAVVSTHGHFTTYFQTKSWDPRTRRDNRAVLYMYFPFRQTLPFFFFLGTNFFSLSLISPNERKKKGGNEGKRKRKEPGFLEEQKIPHLLFDPDSSLPPSCFVCSFPITHCRTQPKKKKGSPTSFLHQGTPTQTSSSSCRGENLRCCGK